MAPMLWCYCCKDWKDEPHDCPMNGNVMRKAVGAKKVALPWALVWLLLAGTGAFLVVEFAKWLGSR